MKKILIIIFITYTSSLFSQATRLERNKDKICSLFELSNEFDSVFTCSDVPRLLFMTPLRGFEELNLQYYKVGYIMADRRIYVCYSYNGEFEFFESRDFDKEFNDVFKPLIENETKVSSSSLVELVKFIKRIYNHNDNISFGNNSNKELRK